MKVTTLGIDVAKNIFQLHGVDERGRVVVTRRVTRGKLMEVMANLPSCLVGMEACIGANYWAREFEKMGHTVKLMSAKFVRPYVKTNKNDSRDAEAICEAVRRPTMRFVAIKTVEQQDLQALHRCRTLLMKNRTALINQIRGLLLEYGVVIPKSAGKVRRILPSLLEEQTAVLTPFAKETFRDLYDQLVDLDSRLERIGGRLERIFEAHPVCQRIAAIPGIGPVTATALVAAVQDPKHFRNGRHLAAWLG